MLGIATSQLSLPNRYSVAVGFVGGNQPLASSNSSNFIFGNVKSFKSYGRNFSLRCLRMGCGRGIIKSVVASAVAEKKVLVRDVNIEEGLCDSFSQKGIGSECVEIDKLLLTSSGESVELDEKERLRRNRISKANKGNTPWNKGRRHSPGESGITLLGSDLPHKCLITGSIYVFTESSFFFCRNHSKDQRAHQACDAES